MIHISDSDKAKWDSGSSFKQVTLSFPNIGMTIGNEEIYSESMILDEGIFDGNGELSVCGCISSTFTIEIRNPQLMPDATLYPSDETYPGNIAIDFKGQKIVVTIKAENSDPIQIFEGYVDSVETTRGRSYKKLTCYDALEVRQDWNVISEYNELENPTVKNFRDAVFTHLGITQVSTTLPNDDLIYTVDENLTELAAIEAVRAICEINGVFGIINREGKFEYRKVEYWYEIEPYPSDELYPSAELYPGDFTGDNHEYIDSYKNITYEDYNVEYIDRVVVRDNENDEETGATGLDGNTLLVEGNLLAKGLEADNKVLIAQNILDNVFNIAYLPFESISRGLPYIEVGDSISYYVYDYSVSIPNTVLLSFNILHRELKGVQWLEDRYSANGTQYQPEVKPDTGEGANGATASDIKGIKDDINTIKQAISDLDEAKQNFIHLDIFEPTWERPEGDIIYNSRGIVLDQQGTRSGYQYVGWRRTNNKWEKMQVAQYSQIDLQAGVSDLPTGEIYLVYE